MLTATKVKLYPDQKQKVLLENHFGSCRFVYNHFLAEGDEYYLTYRYAEKSYLNYLDTQNMRIDLKEKCPWLYKIISQSLQMWVAEAGSPVCDGGAAHIIQIHCVGEC
ncbi:hypothetical protein B9Q04_05795 [Candidatus Marsarchaeota G2 archaeon BE_D]|jgi:putative transposase|uniref:Transposase putative helix-turn-helix domain-containing protein n=1 Tax=Candidatus Marsarchaeota G2 archaeon BE_D TaxID=1978158 RepID=A0A2R6CBV1_9ARCH|nr:MAG: hypothetical protein B9Q04_05795 [Candidatus Marsarchaeota G2 archaeon BE_D]